MEKSRFDYLVNTLPWNLNPDDQKEAAKLNVEVTNIALDFIFNSGDKEIIKETK